MSILYAFLGTLITLSGTVLGASFVFFTKKKSSPRLNVIALGMASGVMSASAIFSLLIPAIEYAKLINVPPLVPISIGFLSGAGFLFIFDALRALKSKSSSPNKSLLFAVTIHNIPEGMAVGLAFALATTQSSVVSFWSAVVLAIGIAIQNIPEGTIISLPLYASNETKKKSFLIGVSSGIVEPIAGVMGGLLVSFTLVFIPYAMAFAAGAMLYVVYDELVPNTQDKEKLGIVSIVLGFLIMMILDLMF